MSKKMYIVMRKYVVDGVSSSSPFVLFEEREEAEKYVNERTRGAYRIKTMVVKKPKVLQQITYRNNWEYHEYFVNGKTKNKDETPFDVVDQNGKKYSVIPKKVTEDVSDHGHTSTATSFQWYVDFSENSGLSKGTLVVPLSKLMKNGLNFYIEE